MFYSFIYYREKPFIIVNEIEMRLESLKNVEVAFVTFSPSSSDVTVLQFLFSRNCGFLLSLDEIDLTRT